MIKRNLSLILVLSMVFSLMSAFSVTADGYYTLTVTTDATEDIQNGDTVVATVTLNTTEGLSGYQYVLKYDPEAFEINTYRNAFINSAWKLEFLTHDEWEVPTDYQFITNVTDGKISNVTLSTYGFGDIPAADALSNVAVMGINLIVKDAEKAKGSTVTILEDNTLVMSTSKVGEDKATIIPAIIPEGAAVVPTEVPTEATPNPTAKQITVTVNGTEVVFTDENPLPDLIIIALYNKEGIMKDVKLYNKENIINNSVNETFTGYTADSFVRVMGWNDLDTMTPVGADHIIYLK